MIGDEIRKERLRKGLSQEKLAYAAGIHPTYVSMLERNLSNPTIGTLDRISKALGLKPWTFYERLERCSKKKSRCKPRLPRVAIHTSPDKTDAFSSARATASESCPSSSKKHST